MPMTPLQATVLAAVQGITEFLPISSSAHLVLVPKLLGWSSLLKSPSQLSFDIALHFGSLIAVIIYFRKDLLNILKSLKPGEDKKLLILLVVATIPAALAGYFLEDFFSELFQKPLQVSIFLLFTGVILFSVERFKPRKELLSNQLNPIQALIIGISQAIAIAPGISRSGSTISAGIYQGLKREEAARFSFLMVIPAIAGAAFLSLLKGSVEFNIVWTIGFLVSIIVSYLAIKFMLGYLKKKSLLVFAYYCWFTGILFIILINAGLA